MQDGIARARHRSGDALTRKRLGQRAPTAAPTKASTVGLTLPPRLISRAYHANRLNTQASKPSPAPIIALNRVPGAFASGSCLKTWSAILKTAPAKMAIAAALALHTASSIQPGAEPAIANAPTQIQDFIEADCTICHLTTLSQTNLSPYSIRPTKSIHSPVGQIQSVDRFEFVWQRATRKNAAG